MQTQHTQHARDTPVTPVTRYALTDYDCIPYVQRVGVKIDRRDGSFDKNPTSQPTRSVVATDWSPHSDARGKPWYDLSTR